MTEQSWTISREVVVSNEMGKVLVFISFNYELEIYIYIVYICRVYIYKVYIVYIYAWIL